MKEISLPLQLLGPALNAVNLKDGSCVMPTCSEIHMWFEFQAVFAPDCFHPAHLIERQQRLGIRIHAVTAWKNIRLDWSSVLHCNRREQAK